MRGLIFLTSIVQLGIFYGALLGFFFFPLSTYAQSDAETITVDLSDPKESFQPRGNGFYHTMTDDLQSNAVNELRPTVLRTQYGVLYDRKGYTLAKQAGAKVINMLFGDYFITHVLNAPKGEYDNTYFLDLMHRPQPLDERPWPCHNGDCALWEQSIEREVQRTINNNMQIDYWEVWSEPDYGFFYGGTLEDYQRVWKSGFQKLRALLPNAKIVGPVAAFYTDEEDGFIKQFLIFARDNNVLPDVLTWSEVHTGEVDVQTEERVRHMKEWMVANNIAISEINVGEFNREADQYNVAKMVHYFSQFQRSGITNSLRGCWNEGLPDAQGNCWNYSFNGLLTPVTKLKRPSWWLYRFYAEMSGQRYDIQRLPEQAVDGVIAVNDGMLKGIIGRYRGTQTSDTFVFHSLNSVFESATKARVVVRSLPSLQSELVSPTTVFDGEIDVNDSQLFLPISDLQENEVWLIEISNVSPSPTLIPSPTPSPTPCNRTADFNGDGHINLLDYSRLAAAFFDTSDIPEDINCDGVVNLIDYSLFVGSIVL